MFEEMLEPINLWDCIRFTFVSSAVGSTKKHKMTSIPSEAMFVDVAIDGCWLACSVFELTTGYLFGAKFYLIIIPTLEYGVVLQILFDFSQVWSIRTIACGKRKQTPTYMKLITIHDPKGIRDYSPKILASLEPDLNRQPNRKSSSIIFLKHQCGAIP